MALGWKFLYLHYLWPWRRCISKYIFHDLYTDCISKPIYLIYNLKFVHICTMISFGGFLAECLPCFIEVTVVYSLPFGPLKTPFQSGIAQTKYQRSVPPRITLNNICYQMCKTFSNICDQFLSHYYRPFVSKTIAKNPPHGPSLRTETFCSFHLKLQNHREQRENLNMFPLCWSNQMWRCRL